MEGFGRRVEAKRSGASPRLSPHFKFQQAEMFRVEQVVLAIMYVS
jgi:hypothetical protein